MFDAVSRWKEEKVKFQRLHASRKFASTVIFANIRRTYDNVVDGIFDTPSSSCDVSLDK